MSFILRTLLWRINDDDDEVGGLRFMVMDQTVRYVAQAHVFTESCAEADARESGSGVQCAVIADVTSASCTETSGGRRDSGISVTSSLITTSSTTTTCLAEQAPLSVQQHAAILEEPSCDVLSTSDEASQPGAHLPALLAWITPPSAQGELLRSDLDRTLKHFCASGCSLAKK